MLSKNLPHLSKKEREMLSGILFHEMMGLGQLEILLKDDSLEEVAVLNSKENLWVYHRKFGWLKTKIIIKDEDVISNYASIIARKVGRRITTLTPLLDAHLETGDRVNATLASITTKGNTLTIRKMRRRPWLVNDLIENSTVNSDVMALLWMSIQYEMSMLVSGGTASGKTTFLNMLMPFIQPNHRVVSIEDTREMNLPKFIHWIPNVVRLPNPEGKGEISMLDLMVNSLRMRPDRIIVGEVRRKPEAEVLFEAMHTGHSVYATIHAETAEQTIRRLTTPPIDLPESQLEALPLIVVCFRQRRLGIRRILQVSEIIPSIQVGGQERMEVNTLYRWRPRTDRIEKSGRSIRLYDQLQTYTGLTESEINDDLAEKKAILEWMVNQKVGNLDLVGSIIADYYWDKDSLLGAVRKGAKPKDVVTTI
jgi:flagellar protein FlaI